MPRGQQSMSPAMTDGDKPRASGETDGDHRESTRPARWRASCRASNPIVAYSAGELPLGAEEGDVTPGTATPCALTPSQRRRRGNLGRRRGNLEAAGARRWPRQIASVGDSTRGVTIVSRGPSTSRFIVCRRWREAVRPRCGGSRCTCGGSVGIRC